MNMRSVRAHKLRCPILLNALIIAFRIFRVQAAIASVAKFSCLEAIRILFSRLRNSYASRARGILAAGLSLRGLTF